MGIGSFLLLIRVKLGTLESKSCAKGALPTRGVPYVTPLTWIVDGRFSVKNNASSSANAPPSECPVVMTIFEDVRTISLLTSARIEFAVALCALPKPAWTLTLDGTLGNRVRSRGECKMFASTRRERN